MSLDETSGKGRGAHPHNALPRNVASLVRSKAIGPGFHPDGNTLYLKVSETGAARWVQRITIRGKRKDIALGPINLVPLAEAREIATQNRKTAWAGGDPIADSKREAGIPSFAEAAIAVHAIHAPSWRNPKHAAQFLSTLETYANPRIGRMSVADVTSADVLRVLTPIWLTKPETAMRVRQRVGLILRWAVAQGWRSDNPAQSIAEALPKQDASKKRHRVALPYRDVSNCIAAVRGSAANPDTKRAFEFLVLTACRSVEARKATWGEVNLSQRVWEIPGSRMKAKKPHRVPLSPRACEILEEAWAFHNDACADQGQQVDKLVFPGSKKGAALSDATLLKLVRDKGFECDIHGFRASFKMWSQEQTSTPRDVSEMALAHVVKDQAEAAYARSDFFEKRRKLMDRWAAYLGKEPAQIVRIGG